MDASRRSLLRGSIRRSSYRRPPWSASEDLFAALCTRCADCIRVCETGLLECGSGGFPEARFERSGCSLCTKCLDACKPGALARGYPAWRLKAEIGGSCLAARGVVCRTCGERCDAGAIRFRPEPGGVSKPRLDAALCTGCGMCLADCPARAIELQPYERLQEIAA